MIWLNKQFLDFTTFPNGETKFNEQQINNVLGKGENI